MGVIAVLVVLLAWVVALRMSRSVPVIDDGPIATDIDWPDMRIDLNVARQDELTVLPQIGSALSARIVEDRLLNGRFDSIDDLTRVLRIGPKTVERLRPFAVVEPAP